MDLVLLISIAISVFAFGASQLLIMRFRVSGYGLLAALTAFFSAVIVFYQVSHLLPGSLGWSISIFGKADEFPGLAVSVMALVAVFFLERLLMATSSAWAPWVELLEIASEAGNRALFSPASVKQ